MMELESQEPGTNRRRLDKVARALAATGIVFDFLGVGVLLFATFDIMGFLITTIMLSDPFSDILGVTLGLSFTPTIKFFPGVLMPFLALPILRVGRRRTSAALLLVGGGLTIPPIVLGGPLVLDTLLASFGVFIFLPHVVGGAVLIAAGVLALLWIPPPVLTPAASVSVILQPASPVVAERGVREVVLVVCPFCGFKNPQGVTRCSNCGGRI